MWDFLCGATVKGQGGASRAIMSSKKRDKDGMLWGCLEETATHKQGNDTFSVCTCGAKSQCMQKRLCLHGAKAGIASHLSAWLQAGLIAQVAPGLGARRGMEKLQLVLWIGKMYYCWLQAAGPEAIIVQELEV